MTTRYDSRSDAELVTLTLAGERAAFEPLLVRHYASVERLCRRLLGSPVEAQDVAQEAALQAFLGLARLDAPARFGAWLHAIAANLARMALRRRLVWSLEALGDGADGPVLWAAPARLPEEVYATREIHNAIIAALTALSSVNREVAIGYYLQGYSYAELATLLGVPVSTVKGRLFKGRRQLRRALAPLAREWLGTDGHARKDPAMEEHDLVPVTVDSIRIGMVSQHRVVMLREQGGERTMPIWIGPFEADAIALALQGVAPDRPMTHDLTLQVLQTLGATVERVIVSRLANSTFFAEVIVVREDARFRIDSRPSDAFALAVRAGAPVFVARGVLDEVGVVEAAPEGQEPTVIQLGGPPKLVNLRLLAPVDQAATREVEWEGQRLIEVRLPGPRERMRLLVHPEEWERITHGQPGAPAPMPPGAVQVVDVLFEGEGPLIGAPPAGEATEGRSGA